jgi:hypothetical protein
MKHNTSHQRGTATIPVVDRALVIVIIAWQGLIKLPHALPPEMPILSLDHLAFVILGATVVVITGSAKLGNAHTYSIISEFRLQLLAEPWALVACSEVVVAVYAARGSSFEGLRFAAAFVTVATAQHKH